MKLEAAEKLNVSFIIPSYNSAKTIGQTVESLLKQTRLDAIKEIIIFDSSDDEKMKDVLRALSRQPLIKCIHTEHQMPPGLGRNMGAQQATGEIVCFVDSDVVLANDWAENVIKAYEEGCRAGGGSISAPDFQKRSMVALAQLYLEFNEYLDCKDRRPLRVVPACNMFCSRKLFQEVGGFPEMRASEDSLLCLKLKEKTNVWFVPQAKCVHIFRESLRDLCRNQIMLGKFILIYRRMYYGSWYYQGLWPAFLLPIFLVLKLFGMIQRVMRAGFRHSASFLLSLPLFLAGLLFWSWGFLQGIFVKDTNQSFGNEKDLKTFSICGVTYHNLTVPEALRTIGRLLKKNQKVTVCYLNADCLNKAQKDKEYKEILNTADLIMSDGIGLKIATRIFGGHMRENCNGTDLYPLVIQMGAKLGYKFYFLGGEDSVAERAAKRMLLKIPNLKVVGSASGYFTDEEKVVKAINDSQADILFVGMGAPMQEKFIFRNRNRLNPRLCAGVGALFNYLSGSMMRAPVSFRVLNLEWAWRIFLEPRRMFKRYVIDGAEFFFVIFKERFIPNHCGKRTEG